MITTWDEGPAFNIKTLWTCEVCGKEITLTAKEAHRVGWDTSPYFTGYIKCEDCPISGTRWFSLVSQNNYRRL